MSKLQRNTAAQMLIVPSSAKWSSANASPKIARGFSFVTLSHSKTVDTKATAAVAALTIPYQWRGHWEVREPTSMRITMPPSNMNSGLR